METKKAPLKRLFAQQYLFEQSAVVNIDNTQFH